MDKLEDRLLTFEDNIHTALWGEERWVVSAHKAGPGIVAQGPFKGKSLCEILPGFPILFKTIDARTRLSVQVHPNEETKLITGGDAKTEMWCALDDGFVYAGLKSGVTPKDIERAVGDGSFEELMVRHELKAGDALFIPGGLVHAIGDMTRVYEVQQSSDTTFRLYDWGRVGADGKPRELHVAQALKAIDYSLGVPTLASEVQCEFFNFKRLRLDGESTLSGKGWKVIYAFKGGFTIGERSFKQGESVLVLEGEDITLAAKENGSEIFVTSL